MVVNQGSNQWTEWNEKIDIDKLLNKEGARLYKLKEKELFRMYRKVPNYRTVMSQLPVIFVERKEDGV